MSEHACPTSNHHRVRHQSTPIRKRLVRLRKIPDDEPLSSRKSDHRGPIRLHHQPMKHCHDQANGLINQSAGSHTIQIPIDCHPS